MPHTLPALDTPALAATTARTPDALSQLVHLAYEAAVRPQGWNNVVAAIGASLGASKGILFTPFVGPQDGGLLFPWRIGEQELQLWATRYIDHDIWSIRAREGGLWREGVSYVGEDLVSDEELHGSVFYQEFLRPHAIEWICTGVVFEGAPGLPHTSVSFFRDRHAPAFGEQDKAWLALLLTHLSRSLGMMHRFKALELRAASLHTALDRLDFGVALLDGQQRVLHLNAAAHAVLARGDGLVLGTDRKLDTLPRSGGTRLQRWLAGHAGSAPERAGHFSDGLLVQRREAGAQYVVQYSVLAPSDAWALDGGAARYVVFITDPGATRLPQPERLTALYGLTPAEARVTLELALGKSQKEVAKDLQISVSTARSHTQSIFAKMRVHRHADLVRTVLSLGQVAS